MYDVAQSFHTAAESANRQVVLRVAFNDMATIGGDYIKSIDLRDIVNANDTLTIGNTCSNQLTLSMYMPNELSPWQLESATIYVSVGFLNILNFYFTQRIMQICIDAILAYTKEKTDGEYKFYVRSGALVSVKTSDGSEETVIQRGTLPNLTYIQPIVVFPGWAAMGVYYTDKVDTKDDYKTVTITAFDGMSLIEHITGNYSRVKLQSEPTAKEAIEDIAETIGVEAVFPDGLPNENVKIVRTAYVKSSYREMLGFFAGFLGSNASFTRDGNLTVKPYKPVNYTITRDQQYLGGITKTTDEALTISSVSCKAAATSEELNVSPTFYFGYYNAGANIYVEDFLPGGGAAFHTRRIPVIPGESYTLRRSRNELQGFGIEIYGYSTNKPQESAKWQDDECLDYSAKMQYNQRDWTFTVKSDINVRYIVIQVDNVEYRDVTPPEATEKRYYEMISSYTLTRNIPENGITIGGGNGITFVNPFINNVTHLQPIYDFYNGLTYMPCTIKYRGNAAIDTGDIVQVEGKDSTTFNAIVSSQAYKIGGGMNATITSSGRKDSDTAVSSTNRYGSSASPTNANDRMQMQIDDLIARVTALENK